LLCRSLEVFDDTEYDSRTPDDWLALAAAERSHGRRPFPARALLPTDSASGNMFSVCYTA